MSNGKKMATAMGSGPAQQTRVFSTASLLGETDPFGIGGKHLAATARLEKPEMFWARKAQAEAQLKRPIKPRSEAQCAGPVQVEIERRGDNRIAARRIAVAGQTSERLYAYDEANRLTRVRQGRNPLERYEYDRLGRRTVESNVLRGLAGRSSRYDLSDRLVSAGEARYEHDAHGFRCQKEIAGRVTLSFYTPDGLLRRVELPDGRAIEYAYDRQGRRVAKAVNGRVVERFAWKGNRLVGWSDGEGATFHYADGRMPVLMVRDGEKYRLCCDQVGTVFAVLDAKNRVVKLIESDTFGNVIADSNPALRLPFGFAGGLADADTGLVRFGARDYDPDTGRWTAKDPLGKAGGDRDLYRYCLADPVNLVDPSGLLFEFWNESEVPESPQEESTLEDSTNAGQDGWGEFQAGELTGGNIEPGVPGPDSGVDLAEAEKPSLKDANPVCKYYPCDENGTVQGPYIPIQGKKSFLLQWPDLLVHPLMWHWERQQEKEKDEAK